MTEIMNRCPGCRKDSCDGCGLYKRRRGSAALTGPDTEGLNTNKQAGPEFPPGFEIEPDRGLGLSFDVGTTTLAGMLWDLEDGRLLGRETASNPQAAFGADVISRIRAAQGEAERREMQRLLVEKLDQMAAQMAGRAGTVNVMTGSVQEKLRREISRVVLVGNTAMCELLLGMEPRGLFRAPFAPDYRETIRQRGGLLGFQFLRDAEMIVLPPIGGYVGSDALAVHGCVSLREPGRKILSVDIGTNGEILLQWGGRKYACSAAAGPALEGGAISQGMRAARGAVDMVSLGGRFPGQDLVCRVIGNAVPEGICGSGLVDLLALLLQTGVVDTFGYMRSVREARDAGTPERICRRIQEAEGDRRFLLTDERYPVFLTARDVRQLQLSVSALRCGMEILLRKAGLKAQELDGICLAGAFGCYIGVESGIRIGLFPDVDREKLIQAGNLAGTGAAMALLSSEALRHMEAESAGFDRVELAQEADFDELFLEHMNFPPD